MPDVIRIGLRETPAWHCVTTLTSSLPEATVSCRFPGADRPGQPPATQHDIRHRGTARHRRIPLQREQGARSRRRASRREEPAIYARKSLRAPSARAPPEAIA